MKKTIENLSDKELVEKYKQWKEIKKFGESVEKEIKARHDEKGLEQIDKIIYRSQRVWKDKDKLPDVFYIKQPMTVSSAIKDKVLKEEDLDNYTNVRNMYSYIIK